MFAPWIFYRRNRNTRPGLSVALARFASSRAGPAAHAIPLFSFSGNARLRGLATGVRARCDFRARRTEFGFSVSRAAVCGRLRRRADMVGNRVRGRGILRPGLHDSVHHVVSPFDRGSRSLRTGPPGVSPGRPRHPSPAGLGRCIPKTLYNRLPP